MYVRVKDPSTGHEFDVLESSVLLRKELVKPVKSNRYPPSPYRRPAKHHLKLAGQSAARSQGTSSEESSQATTPEEI